jgi:hypothetical protein
MLRKILIAGAALAAAVAAPLAANAIVDSGGRVIGVIITQDGDVYY